MLESELFGHEKGSFTGAVERRRGRFELADGGTLFLDEVGDLPMEVQIKLLRTLQERELERVGGNETIKVDVRVVSATNRNLEKMIEANEFREDLYYRLNVFPISLPPLRDRLDDLPVLVGHFVAKFARQMGVLGTAGTGVTADALAKLREYRWPTATCARLHENIVERAMILARARRSGSRTSISGAARCRRPLPARAVARCSIVALPSSAVPAPIERRRQEPRGAPARQRAQGDRRRHREVARQHRQRRAQARHQPLHIVLPPAQARARAPVADQGRATRSVAALCAIQGQLALMPA